MYEREGIYGKTALFGYWLAEPFWGRGIMTAAAHACVDHVFADLPVVRLEAPVFAWNPASMRVLEKCGFAREGVLVILILTFFAVSLCLAAIFALLDQQHDPTAPLEAAIGPWMLVIAGASVLLAWLTSHTVMAFRYAHLYYSADDASGPDGASDARGLAFPGTDEPKIWDFFYYSFVVGMTSQVSDVQACSARMRRATLIHGIMSFLFNTVILALAVNIAVNGHG